MPVKPSPNEIERLLQLEKERKRKERIIQVREQAKAQAAQVRRAVQAEKIHQKNLLAERIREEWAEEKLERVKTLEKELADNLAVIGEGHSEAQAQVPKHELMLARQQQNELRAQERHLAALKQLVSERLQKEQEETWHIQARQAALEIEKQRAAKVASLPPRPADPINSIQGPKLQPVQLTDTEAFSTTHYHIPEQVYVEKASSKEQSDAFGAAEEEEERSKEIQLAVTRAKHEQQEKARVRHQNAVNKELVRQDYEQFLHDISDLRKEDQHKRQHKIAKIPKQIFVPPSQHIIEKQKQQQEIAHAFEDMYMATTGMTELKDITSTEHEDGLTEQDESSVVETETTSSRMSQLPESMERNLRVPRAPVNTATDGGGSKAGSMGEVKSSRGGSPSHGGSMSQPHSDVTSLSQYTLPTTDTASSEGSERHPSRPSSSAPRSPQVSAYQTQYEPSVKNSMPSRLRSERPQSNGTSDTLSQYTLPSDAYSERSSPLSTGPISDLPETDNENHERSGRGEILMHPVEEGHMHRGLVGKYKDDYQAEQQYYPTSRREEIEQRTQRLNAKWQAIQASLKNRENLIYDQHHHIQLGAPCHAYDNLREQLSNPDIAHIDRSIAEQSKIMQARSHQESLVEQELSLSDSDRSERQRMSRDYQARAVKNHIMDQGDIMRLRNEIQLRRSLLAQSRLTNSQVSSSSAD